MTFTPSGAMDFIRQKLRDFYAQKSLLLTQRQEAQAMRVRAEKAGKSVAPLNALLVDIEGSLARHANLERGLAPFANWLAVPSGQIGLAIPLVLAGLAIPVAGLLYLHFQKVRSHRQALDMIAKGLLTPEQAAQLASQPVFTLGTFGVTPLLILGVLGAVFFLGRR